MIGVDTNVLLRLFIVDDPEQNASAAGFFGARSPADPAFVSSIVVAELGWVLRRKYRFTNERIRAALEELLATSDVHFENREIVEAAVSRLTSQKTDFADLLIAALGGQSGCPTTVTFDRNAARHISGMELLK